MNLNDDNLDYIVFEIGVILIIILFCYNKITWKVIISKSFLKIVTVLYFFWLIADLVGVRMRLWAFPEGNNIGIILLGLPIEEHLLFIIHTFSCLFILRLFQNE